MSFAQPLLIPASCMSLKPPEPIDDHLLSDEVGKSNSQPKDLHSLMEYYTETIKVYGILGQVLESQPFRPKVPVDTLSSAQSILNLDAKIMEWRDNLPPYLKHESSPIDVDLFDDHISEYFIPDTLVVLDLPALAKRLHCR